MREPQAATATAGGAVSNRPIEEEDDDPVDASGATRAKRLTARQKAFVSEYLIDFNGARAAERAGYSPRSARQLASRLLTNVDVLRAVVDAKREAAERAELRIDDVIQAYREIVDVDVADVMSWDTNGVSVRPSGQLRPAVRRAVESVSVRHDRHGNAVVQVRLYSKLDALAKLLQYLMGIGTVREEEDLVQQALARAHAALAAKHAREAREEAGRKAGSGPDAAPRGPRLQQPAKLGE